VDKFIVMIIAFYCLSFQQNGVLDTLAEENADLMKNSETPRNRKVVKRGNRLELPLGDSGSLAVRLTDVISRDPAVIGRSTVVFGATSDRWKKMKLVIKISWPNSGRVPETDFIKRAYAEVEKTKEKWVTKHLPLVFYTRDFVFDKDSTLGSVASLFEGAKLVDGKYVYEPRTLRIIIQERLYPLKSLSNVRDIGQVFVDVIGGTCIPPIFLFTYAHPNAVHRWLFDVPGILHRDPSLNNIMFRVVKKKVYGVLTDYDLSSWKEDLEGKYTKTSQQRTGTPPYMAHELLMEGSTAHLYRHDLESFFYIMLLLCGRHTISTDEIPQVIKREDQLPYERWFKAPDYATLGSLKGTFFADMEAIELPGAFNDFRGWLLKVQKAFSVGFRKKLDHDQGGDSDDEAPPAAFDNETLGGRVKYSTIIGHARSLTGELKGLIIRYVPSDASIPPLSTSADAIQTT